MDVGTWEFVGCQGQIVDNASTVYLDDVFQRMRPSSGVKSRKIHVYGLVSS